MATKGQSSRVLWSLLAVLVLVLSACTTQSGQGKKGGTFVLGLVAEPTSLDPAQLTDINSMRILSSIYDTLVQFDENGFDLKPGLATKWTVSPDGLTYTFTLRQGVKFHDGTAFNAAAVKFNFDRMLDPKNEYADTGPFPFGGFYYGSIKETKVVDDSTVQLILSQPYSPLLNSLTLNQGRIVSPDAVKKYRKDFAQHPTGTGPFVFSEWQHGVRVVVTRNDSYWGGAPLLDKIVFRPIPDEQTRYTELKSGNADAIVDVPPDNVAQVKSDSKLTYIEQPGPHIWWVTLNMQKPPFNKLEARQAMLYAINRDAIAKDILKGTGTVANGPIPPSIKWAYTDDVTKYTYDPEKAKQLLASAGYASGLKLTFWIPESGSGMQSPKSMATAIQGDLAKIGVTVDIKTFEWGAYLNKYGAGFGNDADMGAMSFMLDPGDPAPYLGLVADSAASAPAGFNGGYYKSSVVDGLLHQAIATTDQTQRGKLYQQVAQQMTKDVPWIFIDNQIQNAATSTKVHDLKLHPSFYIFFTKIWMD